MRKFTLPVLVISIGILLYSPVLAKENSSQKTAESLLDQAPTNGDLKLAPLPDKAKKDPPQFPVLI